jgi:energy-coupling factor transporter transmembrane protein EcfT
MFQNSTIARFSTRHPRAVLLLFFYFTISAFIIAKEFSNRLNGCCDCGMELAGLCFFGNLTGIILTAIFTNRIISQPKYKRDYLFLILLSLLPGLTLLLLFIL